MFSQLKEDYRKQIIRYWKTYVNDRVMVIQVPEEPTMVLVDDPHEARFIADTLGGRADIPPVGESGYCTFHI